jgi:hypothetical protein
MSAGEVPRTLDIEASVLAIQAIGTVVVHGP